MNLKLTLIILALSSIAAYGQATNDVALDSTWFVGQNCSGITYAKVPVNLTDDVYLIGAQVKNVGLDTQTNVTLTINFLLLDTSIVVPILAPDSAFFFEMPYVNSLMTSPYTCSYSVESDLDTLNGINSSDNQHDFDFVIDDDIWSTYAMDGIGIYSSPVTSSYGTHLHPNTGDGLMLATLYHINNYYSYLIEAEMLLGPETIAGGEVYFWIVDSVDFMDGQPFTSLNGFGSTQITPQNISLGRVQGFLNASPNIPGAYYLVAELYSNGHVNEISVLDDWTVTQPLEASAVYDLADSLPTLTGNAFALRLICDPEGLDEYALSGISIYPNPSDGMVHIANDENRQNQIDVYNLLGDLLSTQTSPQALDIDLGEFGSGVYLLRISNAEGTMSRKMIVR